MKLLPVYNHIQHEWIIEDDNGNLVNVSEERYRELYFSSHNIITRYDTRRELI
jgi:hypothetical protein